MQKTGKTNEVIDVGHQENLQSDVQCQMNDEVHLWQEDHFAKHERRMWV